MTFLVGSWKLPPGNSSTLGMVFAQNKNAGALHPSPLFNINIIQQKLYLSDRYVPKIQEDCNLL